MLIDLEIVDIAEAHLEAKSVIYKDELKEIQDKESKLTDANKLEKEMQEFFMLMLFLQQNPRFRNNKLSGLGFGTLEYCKKAFERWLRDKHREPILKMPKTHTDPAMTTMLSEVYEDEKIKEIIQLHKLCMNVENYIGHMVELYTAMKLNPYGCIYAAGNLIKATDFFWKTKSAWILIQTKNSEQTENSSGSSVRDTVPIEIYLWNRRSSKNEETKWHLFPCADSLGLSPGDLSEKDFQNFLMTGRGSAFAELLLELKSQNLLFAKKPPLLKQAGFLGEIT